MNTRKAEKLIQTCANMSIMDNNQQTYLSVGQTARLLGVSKATLRRWDKQGKLLAERTPSGHRRYQASVVNTFRGDSPSTRGDAVELPTIGYARVSTKIDSNELINQVELLATYCEKNGWSYQIIQNYGADTDDSATALRHLIRKIANRDVSRLVVTHKTRLGRLTANFILSLCEVSGVEVVILNQLPMPDYATREDDADVLNLAQTLTAQMCDPELLNKHGLNLDELTKDGD